MRILTVCQMGMSRSWGLSWMLRKRRHDVLNIGTATASTETKNMVCRWADAIILLDSRFLADIPDEFIVKVHVYHVRDKWGFRPSRDFMESMDKFLAGAPWNESLPEFVK